MGFLRMIDTKTKIDLIGSKLYFQIKLINEKIIEGQLIQ